MNHLTYFNFIEEKLSFLAYRSEVRGSLNILDLNIHAEIFYRDFLNLLFGWNLEKTENHNEAGIDLVDITNRIVVSISATATKPKIESSLNKINPNYKYYAFKFISISKDVNKLKTQSYSNPNKLSFSPAEDIYDIHALIKLIFEMKIDNLQEFFEYMKTVFENEANPEKLRPVGRLISYLHDSSNWKHELGEEQNSIFHYEQFPEFTIVQNDNFDKEYKEPWVFRFPDNRHAHQSEYFAKYHDTILAKIYLVCCDSGRFVIAEPKRWLTDSPQYYCYKYYFVKESIEYLVAQMVTTIEHQNNCRVPSIYREFEMFESTEDASLLIEADFTAGMHKYIYYRFDKETRRYSRIEKGVNYPIQP